MSSTDDLTRDLDAIRPRSVIAGLDGNVIVPASVAREAALVLRAGMRELARRDCRPFSPALVDILAGLEWAARGAAIDKCAAPSTDKTAPSGMLADMEMNPIEVSPARAAEQLGITRQAVAGRLARGTLPFRTDSLGRKRILRSNLEETE